MPAHRRKSAQKGSVREALAPLFCVIVQSSKDWIHPARLCGAVLGGCRAESEGTNIIVACVVGRHAAVAGLGEPVEDLSPIGHGRVTGVTGRGAAGAATAQGV